MAHTNVDVEKLDILHEYFGRNLDYSEIMEVEIVNPFCKQLYRIANPGTQSFPMYSAYSPGTLYIPRHKRLVRENINVLSQAPQHNKYQYKESKITLRL